MKITIQELSQERFEQFGRVIEQPQRPTDASGPGWQWWGEIVQLHGGERPYAVGYLDLKPAVLRFDWAERHLQSDELLVPLGGDCLVYVAPPDHLEQPDRLPDYDQFQVFRVRQGQAVLLMPGVWHGAPLAEDQPLNVLVLLLQNSGKQDVYIRHFEETPVEIQKS